MRRTLVILACLVPFAAACGGGSSHSTAAAPVASAGGSENTSPSSSVFAAAPMPGGVVETTTTKPPTFSGSSGSSWCDLARQVENSTKVSDEFTKDPKSWLNTATSLLNQAESRAPSAISRDVHTVADAVKVLGQALASAGYDFTKISPAQISGLQDPKLAAAGQRITAYDQQVCGTKG